MPRLSGERQAGPLADQHCNGSVALSSLADLVAERDAGLRGDHDRARATAPARQVLGQSAASSGRRGALDGRRRRGRRRPRGPDPVAAGGAAVPASRSRDAGDSRRPGRGGAGRWRGLARGIAGHATRRSRRRARPALQRRRHRARRAPRRAPSHAPAEAQHLARRQRCAGAAERDARRRRARARRAQGSAVTGASSGVRPQVAHAAASSRMAGRRRRAAAPSVVGDAHALQPGLELGRALQAEQPRAGRARRGTRSIW